MIKRAYHQDSEYEGVEVSPREVGHNIYILAQQVSKHRLLIGRLDWMKRPCSGGFSQSGVALCTLAQVLETFSTDAEHVLNFLVSCVCLQLARHNKVLQNLLKPPKKSKEGEEGISCMVSIRPSDHARPTVTVTAPQ